MPAPKLPLKWSTDAAREMHVIERRLTAVSQAAADRVITAILNAAISLTEYPELGHIGKTIGTREMVVPGAPYLIVYRRRSRKIQIVRVLHQSRKFP